MTRSMLAVSLATMLLAMPCRAETIRVPKDHDTIGAAIAAASPGDVIVISKGSYPEAVVVNVADLTLVGKGTVVIAPGGAPGVRVTADGVILRRLKVEESGDDAIRLESVSGCRVESCSVTNPVLDGISLTASSGNEIRNNRIEGCGMSGLRVVGSDNVLQDNHVRFTGNDGIAAQGARNIVEANVVEAIDGDGIDAAGNGNLVIGNEVTTVGSAAIEAGGNGNRIVGNSLAEADEVGVEVFDGDSIAIHDNEIRVCDGAGIIAQGNSGHLIWRNRVTRAEDGIVLVGGTVAVVIHENEVKSCSIDGIRIEGDDTLVSFNRVRKCLALDIHDIGSDNVFLGNDVETSGP